MLRVRFKQPTEDYRPVKWPLKHPYWCTGSSGDPEDHYFVLVAYADSEDEILENWPEAEDLDSEEVDAYKFTSRFPKPQWFKEPAPRSEAGDTGEGG